MLIVLRLPHVLQRHGQIQDTGSGPVNQCSRHSALFGHFKTQGCKQFLFPDSSVASETWLTGSVRTKQASNPAILAIKRKKKTSTKQGGKCFAPYSLFSLHTPEHILIRMIYITLFSTSRKCLLRSPVVVIYQKRETPNREQV